MASLYICRPFGKLRAGTFGLPTYALPKYSSHKWLRYASAVLSDSRPTRSGGVFAARLAGCLRDDVERGRSTYAENKAVHSRKKTARLGRFSIMRIIKSLEARIQTHIYNNSP